MSVGTTANAIMTRNVLIKQSFGLLGKYNPQVESVKQAIVTLNSIIRELDKDIHHLWAVSTTPSTITLQANVVSYDTSAGLPTNILRLEEVRFRDSDGTDYPIRILTLAGYADIEDKSVQDSLIESIYLNEDRTITNRTLFIYPLLSDVETQSEVIGDDANNYRCIRNHNATTDNKPITGTDWRIYWELGGSSGGVWAAATDYTAPEILLLWYRRPLYDFDLSDDDPDVPLGWDKLLMYKLAHALSFGIDGFDVTTRAQLKAEVLSSESKINPSTIKKTNDIYNHATFY